MSISLGSQGKSPQTALIWGFASTSECLTSVKAALKQSWNLYGLPDIWDWVCTFGSISPYNHVFSFA